MAEGKTKYSLEMWAPGGGGGRRSFYMGRLVTMSKISVSPSVTLCCATSGNIQSGSNKTMEEVQVTTIWGCVKVLLLGYGGLLCLQDCEFP